MTIIKQPQSIIEFLGLTPLDGADSYDLSRELGLFNQLFAVSAKRGQDAMAASALIQLASIQKVQLKLSDIAANSMSKSRLKRYANLIVEALQAVMNLPQPDEELRRKFHDRIDQEVNLVSDYEQ